MFLLALSLVACSSSSSSPSTPPAAANVNAPLYPDWARAVVPPYPNAAVAILTNTKNYQFQTIDDRATVAAWYKAHVNASWAVDATSGNLSAKVNGVTIGIYTNPVGTDGKIKTMIGISLD